MNLIPRLVKYMPRRRGNNDTGPKEGIKEKRKKLDYDMDNKELVKVIDERISGASGVKDDMDAIHAENEMFYLGDQLDTSKLFDHQSQVVSNKIFIDIDTIVPILATKKRTPMVMPSQNDDSSREQARFTEDALSWKAEEQQMVLKIADICRFMNIYRLSAIKYRFVTGSYNDFLVEVKRPDCLILDNKPNESEMEFIGEYLEDTIENIADRFGKDEEHQKKLQEELLKDLHLKKEDLGTEIRYIEFWTDEFVVWKCNNTLLRKSHNPNWLWDTKGKKTFNHFAAPKKPYILFRAQHLHKGVYGATTSLEQAKPLQRNINKRKRQISDNADQASGTWIFDTRKIDKKETAKFNGAPRQHICVKGDTAASVNRLYPKDLGEQVFRDLQDDKNEIDNIFGTHSTTRGERGAQKTMGEAAMLKDSDFGRLDLISQYVDRKIEELYNAFVQMFIVYYDEDKSIRILGPDRTEKFIKYSKDSIDEGLKIIVKTEPLLAKAQEFAKYQQMFQAGLIDPLTMYEQLNLPNPKELTRRMIMYNQEDKKMYLAQFAVDENTPGFENDPVNIAKRDIRQLEEGEEVPPAPEVTEAHIQEHRKHLESKAFEKLKDDIKALFHAHISAELEIYKEQQAQIKDQPPANMAGPEQGGAGTPPGGGGMTAGGGQPTPQIQPPAM